MNIYTSVIDAVNPKTGQMERYAGLSVKANNREHAQEWLDKNGYEYCKIDALVMSNVPEPKPETSKVNDFINSIKHLWN